MECPENKEIEDECKEMSCPANFRGHCLLYPSEGQLKKQIEDLTRKLSEIDPKILGSYLFSLRRAWLHGTESHRKQLLPAVEAAFEEYPFLKLQGKQEI